MSMTMSRCFVRSATTFRRNFHTAPPLLSSHSQSAIKRTTINDIYAMYNLGEKITVLTAYDFISGKLADDAGIDMVLVGDSLAMVSLGYEDTNEIPFDEFLYHCKAVSRGIKKSFIVADLPFGSYESSISKAIESSIQLISKGRANAVKLEGGVEVSQTIRSLTQYGIPVVGHVGLTPQRFNSLGGFKVQGRNAESALSILNDALEVQKAGAFAIVLEAIPSKLAEFITQKLDIPTIGIGAGATTSGQVLVQSDMLGASDGHVPKFVKQYSNSYQSGIDAITSYISEVKEKKFPEEGKHTYKMKDDAFQNFFERYNELH